jgi:hypothetical protein
MRRWDDEKCLFVCLWWWYHIATLDRGNNISYWQRVHTFFACRGGVDKRVDGMTLSLLIRVPYHIFFWCYLHRRWRTTDGRRTSPVRRRRRTSIPFASAAIDCEESLFQECSALGSSCLSKGTPLPAVPLLLDWSCQQLSTCSVAFIVDS